MPLIEALATRLRVPNECRELAVLASRHHGNVHRAAELRPQTVLELLEKTDAFRRPERFAELMLACEADARGRAGLEERALSAGGITCCARASRGSRCALSTASATAWMARRSARRCAHGG